jgi:hypothetical protein
MISTWWLVVALIGGGSLGMLLTALMKMSGGLPEQDASIEELNVHPDMMGQATDY